MNVVDSSGWLEYLTDSPNADFFEAAIHAKANLIVPAVCIFEVAKKVLQEKGETVMFTAVAMMRESQVVAIDENVALQAVALSVRHKLPMADSLIYAVARMHEAVLWTQDEHFENLPGVKFIPKKF